MPVIPSVDDGSSKLKYNSSVWEMCAERNSSWEDPFILNVYGHNTNATQA